MKRWLRTTVSTGVVALLIAPAGPALATSLADALVLAYTTNPQMKLQQASLRSDDESLISARGNLLPTLSNTTTLSHIQDLGNSTSAISGLSSLTSNTTLGVQLYDGGADKLTIEAARMSLLAARQNLKNVEQSVLLATVVAFVNVRRDQEFVQLAQNNVRVLREQVRAAKDRFEVGEVTRTDVSQAQARLASGVSALETSRGNLRTSRESYVRVVGIQPKNLNVPTSTPKIPATVKQAEAIAISRHPLVVGAQFSAKAAELALKSTQKNRHPLINGALVHTYQDSSASVGAITNSLTARISGTLTLYAGGQLDSARRSALASMEQAQANVQLQGYIVRENIRNAYTNLLVARASIVSGREQVRAAQVAFEGVREEAKLGARTTLDVLDAEQEALSARTNLVSSTRNEYVAVYAVLSSLGLMTAEHLNLGVPIYNPDVNYAKSLLKQNNPLGLKRMKLLDKLKKRKGG